MLPYTERDLWLSEALERNPAVMSELGGPRPHADIARAHARRVAGNAQDPWWFKVVVEPEGEVAGMLGIWASEWQGEKLYETGWSLRPAFQGRGVASSALGILLQRARDADRFPAIHAFPAVTNGPSNGLCRKFGFELLAEDLPAEFSGSPLRINHWRLALERRASSSAG